MAKITPESIANLKALFQDNEKALGANFSQLIDFFNNNKVTDNGDGTFTVGTLTVDASKLYDLINNSSPNILPLDNEFTGKNTFDIAPINKVNGKPYITEDSVPPVDLSNYPTKDQLATNYPTKDQLATNYPTKDQLATKADDSTVLHNSTKQVTGTDMNTLLTGGYYQVMNGTNVFPGADNWTIYQVVPINGQNGVQIAYGTNSAIGMRSWNSTGSRLNFTSWVSFANTSDVTTAINTATANMADTTKPSNFTNGLQSGGVNVATAADIKSVKDSAWRQLDLSGTSGLYQGKMRIKIDDANKTIYLDGAMYFPEAVDINQNDKLIDLSGVVNNVTSSHGYLFFVLGAKEHAGGVDGVHDCGSILKYNSHFITVGTNVYQPGGTNYVLPFPDQGKTTIYVTYDELV